MRGRKYEELGPTLISAGVFANPMNGVVTYLALRHLNRSHDRWIMAIEDTSRQCWDVLESHKEVSF